MIDEKDFYVSGIHVEYIGTDDEYEVFCGFEIEDSYVELYSPLWKFSYNGYDIFIREGTWYEKDDDGTWMADWSLSWFYMYEDDPQNYLYFEQDGPAVSTYNLLKQLGNLV